MSSDAGGGYEVSLDGGGGYEVSSDAGPGWGMYAGAVGWLEVMSGTAGGGSRLETSRNGVLPIVSGILMDEFIADGITASTTRMYSIVMISHDASVGTVSRGTIISGSQTVLLSRMGPLLRCSTEVRS